MPSNTYVSCGYHAAQQPTTKLTLSCWFKQTIGRTDVYFPFFPSVLTVWDTSTANDSYQTYSSNLAGGSGNTVLSIEINGGDLATLDDGSNTLNVWTHVIWTYDGSVGGGTYTIYVNGVSVATLGGAGAAIVYTGTDPFIIGDLTSHSGSTNGYLADVRIYSRVLSQAEISEIFFCKGTDTLFLNMVSRYLCNEGPVGTAGGASSIKDLGPTRGDGTPSHDQGVANPPWDVDVIKYKRRPF